MVRVNGELSLSFSEEELPEGWVIEESDSQSRKICSPTGEVVKIMKTKSGYSGSCLYHSPEPGVKMEVGKYREISGFEPQNKTEIESWALNRVQELYEYYNHPDVHPHKPD